MTIIEALHVLNKSQNLLALFYKKKHKGPKSKVCPILGYRNWEFMEQCENGIFIVCMQRFGTKLRSHFITLDKSITRLA